MEEAPHLSSFGRNAKKKKKKHNLHVRSLTSIGHNPIEVNILLEFCSNITVCLNY